jgi:hypothetical protein
VTADAPVRRITPSLGRVLQARMTRAEIANGLNALVKQRVLLGWSPLLLENHSTGRYESRWLLNPAGGHVAAPHARRH